MDDSLDSDNFLLNCNYISKNYSSPVTLNNDILKADTGASRTYLQPKHQHHLSNLSNLQNGPVATLPNNEQIKAMAKGNLRLHPELNIESLVYPKLSNESLLSIGQLCDEGCTAIFTKAKLYILRNGQVILTGKRNLSDGLWDVMFKEHRIDNINYIISHDKSKVELAQYLHACAGGARTNK